MELIKKVATSLLLTFGLAVMLLAAYDMLNQQTTPKDKEDAFAALVIFGLPSITLAGWLARLSQQEQTENRDRLQSTFFQLLQTGDGKITVLQFAMQTQLPGEAAKQYLDERAREFDATFEVSDQGAVSYCFPGLRPDSTTRFSATDAVPAGTTFDVILESIPRNQKIAVIKIVRELTRLGLKEAKDLVETTPQPVKTGISWAIAQDIKRKFEAIGAVVKIR
jgi:large subunit ribosomal protein L7/L12